MPDSVTTCATQPDMASVCPLGIFLALVRSIGLQGAQLTMEQNHLSSLERLKHTSLVGILAPTRKSFQALGSVVQTGDSRHVLLS